ncbi:helix-turn-helix domain-containing protein [Halocatena halophila]|uniref:helix-turn-helix domain-containing protein n=1 Tax=Halocatena halophila TaxID=2814576 RepID=UPI002ED3C0B8
MPLVRLSLNTGATDDWLATLSTDVPNTEICLLSSHPADVGLLTVMELRGPAADTVIRRFEDAPDVRSTDVLSIDDQSVLVRATTPIPAGYQANHASEMPPDFPARLQDGWLHTELTGTHEQLSQYTSELEAAGIPFQIDRLSQSHDSTAMLTDRQLEIITEAVERGYYDSPRDCTLTDLAAAFDINKSAASGILHRAEGRIIKAFLDAPAP